MEWSTDSTRKRRAPDDLLEEQPLSKRLELLTLNQEAQRLKAIQTQTAPPPPAPQQERMEVDNVLYIPSLDDELSSEDETDAPTSSGKLIFIPDIERKLTRLPYSLLKSTSYGESGTSSRDLILYTVPASLSVGSEEDSVRRAIIEARERIRRKAEEAVVERIKERAEAEEEEEEEEEMMGGVVMNGVEGEGMNGVVMNGITISGMNGIDAGGLLDDDPDAMEIE
ncbi:hypothetical protein RUND412_011102 [Rhizina undulata]